MLLESSTNPISANDGVTHINVYSKGRTETGRLLSNFAPTPFKFAGMRFASVEGYWYYKLTGDICCAGMSGWQAKQFGRGLPVVGQVPTRDELLQVYIAKLAYNPNVAELLDASTLPFWHYYDYGGKTVVPNRWLWTAALWSDLRALRRTVNGR